MVEVLQSLLEQVGSYPKTTTVVLAWVISNFVPQKYVDPATTVLYKIAKWGLRVAEQLHEDSPKVKDLKKRVERLEKDV